MMGGNAHMMIHECRRKHHFPSNQPDQILQDLNQSINFRKEKTILYNTERKMTEQYGSFGGLDTCNHVEFVNMEKRSILIFENEDKSITNKYDINTHLNVLPRKKVVSSETVNYMCNKAQKFKCKTVVC